jgi:hypothetical protein
MMDFNNFKQFYESKGFCPNDVGRRKNKLNEKQLLSKYDKYCQSENKKIEAKKRHLEKANSKEIVVIDEKWIELVKKVRERDSNCCRLIKILSYTEIQRLKNNSNGLYKIIDPAHVIRRTKDFSLKYDVDNIVCLNRWSHGCLDQYKDPIDGKSISKEDVESWWKLIIGIENYNKLISKIK